MVPVVLAPRATRSEARGRQRISAALEPPDGVDAVGGLLHVRRWAVHRTVSTKYRPCEIQGALTYPRLETFVESRSERDVWFGQGTDDEGLRSITPIRIGD